MSSLAHVLISIQDIANNFNGAFTLKNARGNYFYANEKWLQILRIESTELMGKTDEDIFPAEYAAFVRKTEQQALETKELIQFVQTMNVHGQEVTYLALKWVILHKTGEVFCYCTMGDLVENSEKVLQMQPKIQEIIQNSLSETNPD
ncbi:MAG: PAS domain-containing protein [Bacteroidota bacterium]